MKLYVVVINARAGVTMGDVQARFASTAWYRIAPSAWIIQSGADAGTWVDHLSSLVKPGGTMFVSRLNTQDHQGWMDEKFWDWFNQHS